jgi:hypothetical protein
MLNAEELESELFSLENRIKTLELAIEESLHLNFGWHARLGKLLKEYACCLDTLQEAHLKGVE